ncbi:hypothetical protein DFO67_11063 [Modicisalibacter xianhensis]|uniref:Sodium:proline symporter n=1 Tax=Modicisalibacter xianhensis TaxID=442341 RepID=A0A4R8FXS1_9GAMM|nr:hypothetical protein [Halomonas xianhensis]TDX28363.1 hypothetical protein DFO67_11063 [Halomonas xianhensis]
MNSLIGHQRVSAKGVVWSGLLAGAAFMMLEMVMVWAFLGNSPWGPPRMIAAIVMGRGVLPPPATFAIGIMAMAMAIHFMLSWVYALIYGWAFGGLKLGMAMVIGAVMGLVIYLINFYGFTAIWPWFANARTWISLFSHIMFGIVLALSYQAIANKTA